MKGITNFFSKLAQPQAPVHTSPQDILLSIWNQICSYTLVDSHESLIEIHNLINRFLKNMDSLLQKGFSAQVTETLSMHQIPKQLVSFAYGNIPKNLVNEVIQFFLMFTKLPFSTLLPEKFIIDPLNALLENPPYPNNDQLFYELVVSLMRHVAVNNDRICLFLTTKDTSPLLHQFSQYIVTNYGDLGDVLMQLIIDTKNSPNLLNFILTYSPLISTLIDICKDCIEKKIDAVESNEFLEYLNYAIDFSPPDFQAAFSALFDETVIKPMIVHTDVLESLTHSIYILCCFTSVHLIEPVYQFIISNLNNFLQSNFETIIFLAIRCVTLLFEISDLEFDEIIPPNIKISLDFMQLINAEWFLRPNVNQQLLHSRARVSMNKSDLSFSLNLTKEPTKSEAVGKRNSIKFDVKPVLPVFLKLLSNYVENSLRVNLALTEFFSLIASLSSNAASYFSLSEDCPDGLYRTLATLCTLVQRRIGNKPGTTQEIEQAYGKINSLSVEEATLGLNELNESNIYCYVVLLLEFLKELHSTAQSKNLINQRDSLITKDLL
ncbi:hypothetical protein TRFO_22514 [Tritrichomonas foetus]|uniref:Uncharacterized protein n=1 Tax=Tritrichomonas foetus TaxID=1144522 RepID=A0A1J4KD33_9EUKA|nr:hypothetical protein TRFO_22514 [Tritrichomonas foetus]|eukprot:OHT08848.1 hypothetical protein TRFO_22514 [Tritrichomonas foetus]